MSWCNVQKFAEHYASCVFLKFFGNTNENTKYLFRDRLQTPLTPTFSFWRRGEALTSLRILLSWHFYHRMQAVLIILLYYYWLGM